MKKTIENAINAQIKEEFHSAYIYLGMAAYAESINLSGFANWFTVQFKEETDHAFGLYNHINERGGKVELATLPKPACAYKSIEEAVKETLKHEQFITVKIHSLVELSRQEKDYALDSFLTWYIDEQVEEEDSVTDLLEKVKMVKGNSVALYMLDKELSARIYTPASILGSAE